MQIPKSIRDAWMMAHVRAAMDSQTDLAGNSHDAWTVQATIYFVLSAMGLSADYANEPTRQDLVEWMKQNGMEDEIEYLMEE